MGDHLARPGAVGVSKIKERKETPWRVWLLVLAEVTDGKVSPRGPPPTDLQPEDTSDEPSGGAVYRISAQDSSELSRSWKTKDSRVTVTHGGGQGDDRTAVCRP